MCKITFYIQRVAQGVSLCTTCLLSGFQAITVSPNNSWWAELKPKAPRFVQPSCCLCWNLHLLINIIMPVKVTHPRTTINITKMQFGLCATEKSDSSISSLYSFLFTFLDILCLGPMGWATGFIVLFLQRHRQSVKYRHRAYLSLSQSFPRDHCHSHCPASGELLCFLLFSILHLITL